MSLPVMTPEMREIALAKAAAARKERSAALASLRDGTATLADVLSDQDSPLQRARVRQVLLALPKVGPKTADKMLAAAGVDPKRRVSGLGNRQRAAIFGSYLAAA